MQKIHSKIIAAAILSFSLFAGCNKNVSSGSGVTSSDQTVATSTDGTGNTTVIFRPNAHNGQDGYVNNIVAVPNSANANNNSVPELCAGAWTYNGLPDSTRFFIKFDSLAKVPATATIVSATLQLFGLNGSSLSAPQGNSVYPGSPYVSAGYTDNSLLVQRVIKPWNAATITWANQPATTMLQQVTIPSSTAQWDYNPKIDVTNLVKKMVANPAKDYGFAFRQSTETIYRSMLFGTCEQTEDRFRPKLTVVYQ